MKKSKVLARILVVLILSVFIASIPAAYAWLPDPPPLPPPPPDEAQITSWETIFPTERYGGHLYDLDHNDGDCMYFRTMNLMRIDINPDMPDFNGQIGEIWFHCDGGPADNLKYKFYAVHIFMLYTLVDLEI
jgi:hypothetical protein